MRKRVTSISVMSHWSFAARWNFALELNESAAVPLGTDTTYACCSRPQRQAEVVGDSFLASWNRLVQFMPNLSPLSIFGG